MFHIVLKQGETVVTGDPAKTINAAITLVTVAAFRAGLVDQAQTRAGLFENSEECLFAHKPTATLAMAEAREMHHKAKRGGGR